MEGIILKAAGHWVSTTSVVNNRLGEAVHTSLYVGLPPVWHSVGGDCFPYVLWESSLTGDSKRYEWMNKPMAKEMEHLFL